MRIIEENPIIEERVACNNCGCVIGYNKDEDTVYASSFGKNICCPKCGNDILIEKFDKPLKFPDTFYYFNGKDSTDDEIRQYCLQGLKYLHKYDDEEFWYMATGNLYININKYKEDSSETCYEITVAKNYWSTEVWEKDIERIINE